jgi:hypothetical protein
MRSPYDIQTIAIATYVRKRPKSKRDLQREAPQISFGLGYSYTINMPTEIEFDDCPRNI